MRINNRTNQSRQRGVNPRAFLSMVLCALFLAGCGSEPRPEPTAEVPPTATESLAVIAEPSATPLSTPLPTPTETSTEQPAAAPVVAAASITETTDTATTDTEASPEQSDARDENGNCLTEFALDLAGYPDLEASMGCAIQEALLDPVAINEFGQGPDHQQFMLWFGATEQIVVLLPDSTWQGYLDTWTEDEAEIQCNPTGGPNESPPLPRRGFGKLWCSDSNIQTQMGTIEREERLCQHAVIQRFEQGRLVACFEDGTIRYFRLLEDGSWSHLFVQ